MYKYTSIFFLFFAGLLMASCSSGKKSKNELSGSIKIDGSSTVYPISEAVAEEFRSVAQQSGRKRQHHLFIHGKLVEYGAMQKILPLPKKITPKIYHPGALDSQGIEMDLRFVLAAIKINTDLERLGDHADSIAKYILDFGQPIDKEIIKKMRIKEMFSTSSKMMNNIFNALITEDTDLARHVFTNDKVLNDINRNASKVTTGLIRKNMDQSPIYLYLFTIIRKLERVDDLTKNVAEEIIFYIEAKVLKHQKMKSHKDNTHD